MKVMSLLSLQAKVHQSLILQTIVAWMYLRQIIWRARGSGKAKEIYSSANVDFQHFMSTLKTSHHT